MRILSCLLLVLFPLALMAQKETSRWFLRQTSNLVEPSGVTTGLPAPNNFSGAFPTSVSDADGNLLFASDGNTVVDRDLQPMPGMPIAGFSGGNGRVLAQKIPNSTRYSIFYTSSENPSFVNAPWTLKYAIVDMALNGGKGDLVSYDNLVSSGMSPGYTIIQDNSTDNAWLVAHRITSNIFHSYPITATGVSPSPIISTAGAHTVTTDYIFNELKTSHDGSMVAGLSDKFFDGLFPYTRQYLEVFYFDFSSAMLSSKVFTSRAGKEFRLNSLEFSPDNRLLYVGSVSRVAGLQPCGFGSSAVRQYNLCYNDPIEFQRYSTIIVGQHAPCYPQVTYGKIQMGADKRIHMPFAGVDISTIEFPNRIGTSGTYSRGNYQVASPNFSYLVTPGFQHREIEKAVKNNIRYNGGCYPDPTRFHITNDTITRIEWEFGDPASGAANTSTLKDPSHLFSAPGIFNVTARLFNSNNQLIETVYELVEIKDPDKRILYDYPADTSFCQGGELNVKLNVVNGIFNWFQKSPDGNEYSHHVIDSMIFISSGKWYVEMRQNDCNGCRMLDSINITVLPKPIIGLGPDRSICNGDSVLLQVHDAAADFLWSDGSTNTSIWVKTSGTYWVQAEYNNNGCPVRDSINITVTPNVVFSLPPDTTLCNEQVLLLDPGVASGNYEWQDGSTSPQFLVQSTGDYWVKITNSFGCVKADTIQVNYLSAVELDLGTDKILCNGQTLTLHANIPAATYLWSNGSTANQITVDQAGDYWLRVDNGTCVLTDTITIRFDDPPIFNLGADTTLCAGEFLLLSPGIPGSQYAWQDATTASTFMVTGPGTYWVDIIRGGCKVSDTIVIDYFPIQPVALGPDKRECEGETVILDAGNSFIKYLWSNGAVSSSLHVSAPGEYSVVATSSDGCQSKDTVMVLPPYPLPNVTLDNNHELCFNTSRILDAGPGFANYLWNNGTTSRTKTISQIGTYSVTVTDNNGCSGQDEVTISSILPLPAQFLPADTLICQYETILLQPNRHFVSYLWSSNTSTASIEVSQPGTFTLQVTDSKGCIGTDEITVMPKECMEGVFIPSAFTPNGDGRNDVFKPLVFGPVSRYSFTVYNRWGQIIHRSTEPGKGWDGTLKGRPADTNIFVWTCTYQLNGQDFQYRKGHVTLVR